MPEVITVIYENGLLRPLEPLHLKEQQKVRIQVLPESAENEVEVDQIIQTLVSEGALTLPSGRSEIPPVSATKRQQLADRLGQATIKPLSEIIIEERGDW